MTTELATIPKYPYGLTMWEWWELCWALQRKDFQTVSNYMTIGITRQFNLPARYL